MTTPLASLPTTQNIAAVGGGVIYLGANANPVDANADFTFCPTGAGKYFVINTTSTQPFIVRHVGGTAGTHEIQMYHDGTLGILVSNSGSLFLEGAAGTTLLELAVGNIAAFGNSCKVRERTGLTWQIDSGFYEMYNAGQITWSSGSTAIASFDTGLKRVAPGVVGASQGTTAPDIGWLQNTAGMQMLNADATNATNTLASSNIAFTLQAGRSYSIRAKITGGNSLATEGFKIALTADGTLTATRFDLSIIGSLGTIVAGTQRVTSLGTPLTDTTFTAPSDLWIVGEIKVGVAGVLTLQFAENSAHVSGTATLSAGSWVELQDSVAI